MKKKRDKRKITKRLAVDIKVRIYRLDKDTSHKLDAYLFETKDLTQKGLFIRTPKTFPKETKLRLEFDLSQGQDVILAEGRVARIARRSEVGYYPGMGIEVTSMRRGDGKKLREFLKNKFCNYRHALELKKMYLELKGMAGRLYDIEQSYEHAEHFKKVIESSIAEIDHIAHILDREVWEVKTL